MAIYFPNSVDSLEASYNTLVRFDSQALTDWKAFLDMLYTRTADFRKESRKGSPVSCTALCTSACKYVKHTEDVAWSVQSPPHTHKLLTRTPRVC
jgi:hypothetical protein